MWGSWPPWRSRSENAVDALLSKAEEVHIAQANGRTLGASYYRMRFEPLICIPTAWTSVSSRFAIHVFEGRVTLDDMELMQRVGERWNKDNPGKRVELSVVLPSDTRLSDEERVRMGRLIKLGESHRTASATVILAEGMLASMQRSMLAGMMMLAPPPHPTRVFGKLADAAQWLLPHVQAVCDARPDLDELSASLEDHLAQFRTRLYRAPVRTSALQP
jgi:hypothetical protein